MPKVLYFKESSAQAQQPLKFESKSLVWVLLLATNRLIGAYHKWPAALFDCLNPCSILIDVKR